MCMKIDVIVLRVYLNSGEAHVMDFLLHKGVGEAKVGWLI